MEGNKYSMTETQQITSILAKKKKAMIDREDPCIFCGHGVGRSSTVQLAHLIRRSERIEGISNLELQTMDDNIGLAHPQCHEIFDDRPRSAVNLPRIFEVLDRIKSIDKLYYNRLMMRLEPYFKDQIDNPKGMGYEYRVTESETYIKIFINQDFSGNHVARKINKRRRR